MGHRKFLVQQAWNQTDVQLHSQPYTAQTVPVGKGAMTTGVGGGTSSVQLPQASYVIRILDDSQDQDPNAYDARMIQASVRGKYRLPEVAR